MDILTLHRNCDRYPGPAASPQRGSQYQRQQLPIERKKNGGANECRSVDKGLWLNLNDPKWLNSKRPLTLDIKCSKTSPLNRIRMVLSRDQLE